LRSHRVDADRTPAPTAPRRTAGSDPLDSDQGKPRRRLAANVDRHRELRPPCASQFGTPAGHHLGTPRPMRSRVTTTGGRFPGSRVVAFDRLPRDNRPQWLFWPSARRLQLRGQLRNCIPVIAVGVRAPHSLGYPLARNHREHARIEVHMSQEVRLHANLEGF
jgi:hypothetical protein